MKNRNKYLIQGSVFLLSIFMMFGCVQWEEFESIDVASAPTVTVVVSSAADSSIVVDVTSSMDGFVAAILLTGTANDTSDAEALLTGNVLYESYAYGEAEASVANSFAFSAVQDSDYEIMAVAANSDGVVSSVAIVTVATTDTHAPTLVSISPESSYSAATPFDVVFSIEYDENVVLGDGEFSFETWYGGEVIAVAAEDVNVAGNIVSFGLPFVPDYREYLWLHWEEGTVTDNAGNAADGFTTVFDGAGFVGAYWRVVAMDMDVVTVAPDVAVAQAEGFDIVLTFSDGVDAGDVADGDITLEYNANDTITMYTQFVPAADVVASGNTLTISQTGTTLASGMVTLTIPEGLLFVGIGNPVVAIKETWNIAEVAK